ncbi:MAG: hypothetical protein R2932_50385 [Caldilineaceae bacterium]
MALLSLVLLSVIIGGSLLLVGTQVATTDFRGSRNDHHQLLMK